MPILIIFSIVLILLDAFLPKLFDVFQIEQSKRQLYILSNVVSVLLIICLIALTILILIKLGCF